MQCFSLSIGGWPLPGRVARFDIQLVYQWLRRSPFLQLDPDAALSLSDRAYYGIRELIVSLELAPGSPVSERELMERLGLGRTPVREALRTLAQEKLVEVYPRRGIVVSPVDVGDLASLSEARIVLESCAARLAAERANAADREVARALLAELPGADDEHDERAPDRARPAHPPPRLPLRAQRLRRVDPERVLHPHAAHLVPRARPRGAARRRRHRASRAARGDLRRPTRAEDVMRRHIESFERAIRAVL